MVVLTQNGLKKALGGKSKKPESMTDEQWEELDEKALSTIQLCLAPSVLREVLDKTTTAEIWLALESLYMTKSLFNKIRLKERLYTFSMAEGIPIQNHLDEFNSILIDLESMDVKIEDEDKAILLVVSLPSSYKHFKEILLYSNKETLSFEDVKASLLSKEKFDLEMRGEKIEGLFVRGEFFDKRNTDKSTFKGRKPNKFCKYCKKRGHLIDECWHVKDKREKEENHTDVHPHEPGKVTFVESDSDGDVLFATSTKKGNNSDLVLDSRCTYLMCSHKD